MSTHRCHSDVSVVHKPGQYAVTVQVDKHLVPVKVIAGRGRVKPDDYRVVVTGLHRLPDYDTLGLPSCCQWVSNVAGWVTGGVGGRSKQDKRKRKSCKWELRVRGQGLEVEGWGSGV